MPGGDVEAMPGWGGERRDAGLTGLDQCARFVAGDHHAIVGAGRAAREPQRFGVGSERLGRCLAGHQLALRVAKTVHVGLDSELLEAGEGQPPAVADLVNLALELLRCLGRKEIQHAHAVR